MRSVRAVDAGRAAMREKALQAEDCLVKMKQRDFRIVTFVEHGPTRLGHMFSGLRTKLG